MAVPTVMADLSTTIATNVPAGSEARSSADDYLRALSGIIRREATSGSDIASATTITPDALAASYNVTGTTAIVTIATTNGWPGRIIVLTFTGALTLTHNASTLILPGGANITTAANDHAVMRQIGTNAQECLAYTKASGVSIVVPTLAQIDSNWSFDASHRLLNGGNTQTGFFANTTGADQTSGTICIFGDTAQAFGFNDGAAYATGTGIFTAPVSGKYTFACNVLISNTSGGSVQRQISIKYNNTNNVAMFNQSIANGAIGYYPLNIASIKMAATDTMRVLVDTAFSASIVLLGAVTGNCFSGRLLS